MTQPMLLRRRPPPSSSSPSSIRRPRRRRSGLLPTTPTACLRCVVGPVAPASSSSSSRRAPSSSSSSPLLLLLLPSPTQARPLSLSAAVPPGQEDAAPRRSDQDEDDQDEDDQDEDEDSGRDDPALDPLARLALGALRFYRQGISPLLQPACRYQPTCSRYAIAAYRTYGGWRGTVLTAWRLARCAPWGAGGYDPPDWPPRGLLEPVFARYDAAAPVAVVLGVAGLVRLFHALLFE